MNSQRTYEDEKSEMEETLASLSDELAKSNTYQFQFSIETLAEFIINIKNAENPLEAAKKYSENVETLIITLRDLYPSLTTQKAKYRFTKAINTLQNAIDTQEGSDATSTSVDQESDVEYY